jgi:kynurenine formamidase
MYPAVTLGFLLGALAACATLRSPERLEGRLVDLTHPFDETTIYWPTETEGFVLERIAEGPSEGGGFYAASRFRTAEHGGTHLDAPFHFSERGRRAGEVPLEQLVGPAVVIDVRERAQADPDHRVQVADLAAFEARHGRIAQASIVLLHTGWSERWPDRARVLGTERRGAGAVRELHFPGLDPEAARWLVDARRVASVGIDTPSIDSGPSERFEAHRVLAEAQVPVFENLARLGELPPRGALVIALPMKIARGTGAPLRAIALVPEP